MKIEGKFIFKVAGTLTAISVVVALLLGLTNKMCIRDRLGVEPQFLGDDLRDGEGVGDKRRAVLA